MAYVATCHCGATRIEVDRLPAQATRCNCTWCERTGGLWGYYKPEEIRILAAPDRIYAPRVQIEHHFCGTCSGMMFNLSPAYTEESLGSDETPTDKHYGLNLRMIDDDAARSLPVTDIDGRHLW